MEQPFKIGAQVRLRRMEKGAPAYIARVEDLRDGRFSIQRPIYNYEPVRLHPGTVVEVTVVRTQHPEGIFRGKAVVLGETGHQPPLVHLQLPEQWERAQLREFFRVPAVRPIRLRPLDEGDDAPWMETTSRDLSGGGCQIVLPTRLEQGQLVEIELELPDGVHRMRGMVRRVAEEISGDERLLVGGIQFIDLPERQREEIIRYAFERQIELRKKGVT